ncbi:hypothetical protein GGS20DRAFT_589366 [Poronia punctata]|nr:hypothetical protein GGS20DRAFT_589366 [Poronia punctata]
MSLANYNSTSSSEMTWELLCIVGVLCMMYHISATLFRGAEFAIDQLGGVICTGIVLYLAATNVDFLILYLIGMATVRMSLAYGTLATLVWVIMEVVDLYLA